jgi:uncharacterized membrane protein
MSAYTDELNILEEDFASGNIDIHEYNSRLRDIESEGE